ncbi:MAG: ABC transporter permease subunit, partial [Pirellulaceae bacterium]|nr:ABC transporter permease subunit [Pirellulaceae bacterium]
MRAYLAIIKDSFREALASRILYIMLGLISLLLLLAAPLTYRLELTTGVREGDAEEWPDLIDKLKQAEAETKPSPTRRIWTLLTAEQQKHVRDFKRLPKQPQLKDVREFQQAARKVIDALDEVAKKPELHDKPSWAGVSVSFEGRQLLGKGAEKLDSQDTLRLNRILIEAAFPGLMRLSPTTSFQFRYSFVRDFGPPLPITRSQFHDGITATLPYLVDKFLLAVGLLVAILVTSPIIPQTFDPGSLHLLLSKPIGRSLLYLTKFAGGCAFVMLCATYLFVGLWLLLGTRFGIWEPSILMCIPLYAFVFAIYYSVAALAGMFWRNAIVSVIVAVVFWGICFGVGSLNVLLEGTIDSSRLKRVVVAGDDVVAMDASKTPWVWDKETNAWKITFLTDEQKDFRFLFGLANGRNLGPAYDPKHKQLVGATLSLSNGQLMIVGGKKEKDWKPQEGPPAPISPVDILNEPDGTPLLVTNYSIQRVTGEITPPESKVKFLGYTLPSLKGGALTDGGPRPAQGWGDGMAPAIDPKTGLLYIYDGGEFTTLALQSGRYERQEKKRIWEKDRGRPVLAACGGTVLLGRANGQVVIFDGKTLETKETLEPEKESRVEAMAASPSGKTIAVLFENRRLWMYNVEEGKLELSRVTGQRDISAVTFASEDRLLVADRTDRVTEYSEDMSVSRRISPSMSLYAQAFRYGITPIYTICPKPGEFYKTVTHILADPPKPKSAAGEDDGNGEVRASSRG